jgi:hypothetical protein
MSKKKKNISLIILIIFSIYCSLSIGLALDEQHQIIHGKITLDYLFSLGKIDKYFDMREYYSTIYWSLLYFITEIFPSKYETEVSHLVNLIFSFAVIFGIGKVSKELFNKKVGEIIFVILFFYPIFFGHMSINGKDTILALSHVWMIYLILRYLKKQEIRERAIKYIVSLGFLAALSTGIQLTFLGSQIPIILFILIEIFFLKKIINKNFSKKRFLYDIIKCFLVFYLILILFWIDVHQNILIQPFHIIWEFIFSDFKTGWPFILLNGNYYFSFKDVPSLYFLINFIYKSPEYVLLTYPLFVVLIIGSRNFFETEFKFFYYKLSFIIFTLIFPNLIMFVIPFPINDGMRLFLWVLPYYCIIPGLTIYYLIKNFKLIKQKITLLFLSLFFVYYLFNFVTLTPYQYTYLNFLNGKIENRYQKFENDYWATSIKELIKSANFKTDKIITMATCGFISSSPKHYLKKRSDINYRFVPFDEAEYIIMTNRVSRNHGVFEGEKIATNCFDFFKGDDVAVVKRNGMILSVIRKIKKKKS